MVIKERALIRRLFLTSEKTDEPCDQRLYMKLHNSLIVLKVETKSLKLCSWEADVTLVKHHDSSYIPLPILEITKHRKKTKLLCVVFVWINQSCVISAENAPIPSDLKKDAVEIQKSLAWDDEGGEGIAVI